MIRSSQRPLPDNTQHSQQTNIYAPGGIRTHDLSRRAAADLRLRPRGHWDRRSSCIRCNNTFAANHNILTNQGLTHTAVNMERLILNHSLSRNCKKQFNIIYMIWYERGWNLIPGDCLYVQLIKGEDRNSNCGNQSLLIMTGWNVAETR